MEEEEAEGMEGGMEKVFSIPSDRSHDPEYWAYAEFDLAIFDGASEDMRRDTRSIMATVALLHNLFPDREAFDAGEVDEYREQIYAKFPHLQPLGAMPEAC